MTMSPRIEEAEQPLLIRTWDELIAGSYYHSYYRILREVVEQTSVSSK